MILRALATLGCALGRAMAEFATAGAGLGNRRARRGGAAAMLDEALDHPRAPSGPRSLP